MDDFRTPNATVYMHSLMKKTSREPSIFHVSLALAQVGRPAPSLTSASGCQICQSWGRMSALKTHQLCPRPRRLHKNTGMDVSNGRAHIEVRRQVQEDSHTQPTAHVVSSQPHIAIRLALLATLRQKNRVLKPKTTISGIIKLPQLSMGLVPHPVFAAYCVAIIGHRR